MKGFVPRLEIMGDNTSLYNAMEPEDRTPVAIWNRALSMAEVGDILNGSALCKMVGHKPTAEWQPMETAPKGTDATQEGVEWIEPPYILLAFENDMAVVGVWQWNYYNKDGRLPCNAWIEPISGEKLTMHGKLIGWMPLPDPPRKAV